MTKKCVDIIVGSQFGSEGKGKLAAYLAGVCFPNRYAAAVRVGGPNAGHTVQIEDKKFRLCQLSCAGLVDEKLTLCIGAGGLVDEDILREELEIVPNAKSRFFIDRNTAIITEKHRVGEKERRLFEKFKCEGVGETLAEKLLRSEGALRAEEISWLRPYIINVSVYLNELVDRGEKILLEGTQGYGISLNYGYWPYVTSRDVLASSLLSDCGLSPFSTDGIYLVLRSYPVRVPGTSGPMESEEITWEEVRKRSGAPVGAIKEFSNSTKKERRVSEFNMEMVLKAVKANRPSVLVLMFSQYLNWKNRGVTDYAALSSSTKDFVEELQDQTGVPVALIGTGLGQKEMCNRWANGGILLMGGQGEYSGKKTLQA